MSIEAARIVRSYLGDPRWLAFVLAYGLVRVSRTAGHPLPWGLNDHLADVCLVPCLMPVTTAAARAIGIGQGMRPSLGELWLQCFTFSIVLELWGPWVCERATGDPLDVIAYGGGALLTGALWPSRGRPRVRLDALRRLRCDGASPMSTWGALALVRFYQCFVSSRLNVRCIFAPSCSEYCAHALRVYGLLSGLELTRSRIQRCRGTGRLPLLIADPVPAAPRSASGRPHRTHEGGVWTREPRPAQGDVQEPTGGRTVSADRCPWCHANLVAAGRFCGACGLPAPS